MRVSARLDVQSARGEIFLHGQVSPDAATILCGNAARRRIANPSRTRRLADEGCEREQILTASVTVKKVFGKEHGSYLMNSEVFPSNEPFGNGWPRNTLVV